MSTLIPCLPPRWARGGHAQTLWAHFLPTKMLESPGQREDLALPDGDRLVCHWLPTKGQTVVYLFHGLGGHSQASYIQRTAKLCVALGFTVCMMNHRGCGAGEGLARGPYHSGRGEDLARVIAQGRRRYPHCRHIAVGFSLSGNALLLLLSGARGDTLPDAAVTVNAPISLENCSQRLRVGWNRIYDTMFLLHCLKQVRTRRRAGLLPDDLRVGIPSSLYAFEEAFTAPVGGFKDRADYYATCSTKSRLSRISVPTVLITSKDDPLVPYEDYLEAKLGPRTRLHLETHGGHMGYLAREKTPFGTRRWLDYALHHYLSDLSAGL